MKLLKFGMSSCGPCKTLEEVLEQNHIEHESIDCEENEELADKYSIRNVPTLIKVDDEGNELARISGNKPFTEIKEVLGL